MDHEGIAAGLGIAGCAAVVALTALPYAIIDAAAVGAYYDRSPVGPPVVALFAVVAAVVFLAAYRRRSDPALAAGVALVIAAFMALLAVFWAVSVPASFVAQLTMVESFAYHRWAFALSAAVVAAAAGWYVRAVVYPETKGP